MKFLKIEKKEYKKLAKEFRKTYIGGKLYLIFDCLICLWIFCEIIDVLYSFAEETKSLFYAINSVNSSLLFIVALISYYVYFKHLKEYIEKKNIEEEIKKEK